jgi:hypothetical protein
MQFKKLLDQISKNLTALKKSIDEYIDIYISSYTSLLFTSRQTGYTRKELSTWNKADLLPYKISNTANKVEIEFLNSTTHWRRYSLIECIWIKVVVKLMKYGIHEAVILDLKKQVFQDVDSIEKNEPALLPDDRKIYKLRNSHFGKILMHTTMYHIEFSILVSESGDFAIISHGLLDVNEIYKSFSDKTFVAINVSSLMKSFISSDEVSLDADFFVSILHPKEREVIRQIKQNVFKQVTLSLKDGSITHYHITKDREANEQTIKNIARMLKKEDYQSIQCASIDDTVVTFEEEALTSLV